jgi:hypothetical protein
MTSSSNASVVKIYNATNSLARFENKKIFFYFEKCSSLRQRCLCSCEVAGLSTGKDPPQWEKAAFNETFNAARISS